jgi:hypothetical protein
MSKSGPAEKFGTGKACRTAADNDGKGDLFCTALWPIGWAGLPGHKEPVAAPLDLIAIERLKRWSGNRFPAFERKAGMVPGTTHLAIDKNAILQWRAKMRTFARKCANSAGIIREHHRLTAYRPAEKRAFRQLPER